jgi:hypothetical protein
MPWIIGTVSPLSWSDARDKIRSDLWRKGTTAIPDDAVDRALHASILDVESRRTWLWLEQVNGTITLGADADRLTLPTGCSRVQSLSVFYNTNPFSDPLELVPLPKLREMVGAQKTFPSYYALSNGQAFFDCVVPSGTKFEMIFQAKCPDLVTDAVATPPYTLGLHQQACLAGAKALVALEYLHDDDKATRANAAFENHLRRMEDADDQVRDDDRGGSVQPYTAIQDAAFGLGWGN